MVSLPIPVNSSPAGFYHLPGGAPTFLTVFTGGILPNFVHYSILLPVIRICRVFLFVVFSDQEARRVKSS
jgi:hypothetical protein